MPQTTKEKNLKKLLNKIDLKTKETFEQYKKYKKKEIPTLEKK